MQPFAVRCGDRNPGSGVLRWTGRPFASLCLQEWPNYIWDVDTIQDYATVNGVSAHGGALDGPGSVVAGGMLYVNSGYTNYGTAPGNVLLAFSVDGQ